LNYYLIPQVPIAPFPIGSTLRYADGSEIPITVRTSEGTAECVIVRIR
jgi:hypothetical protein